MKVFVPECSFRSFGTFPPCTEGWTDEVRTNRSLHFLHPVLEICSLVTVETGAANWHLVFLRFLEIPSQHLASSNQTIAEREEKNSRESANNNKSRHVMRGRMMEIKYDPRRLSADLDVIQKEYPPSSNTPNTDTKQPQLVERNASSLASAHAGVFRCCSFQN